MQGFLPSNQRKIPVFSITVLMYGKIQQCEPTPKIILNNPSDFGTAQVSARKLRKFLLNKNVVAMIAFNLDIQELFKLASLEFQKKVTCLRVFVGIFD